MNNTVAIHFQQEPHQHRRIRTKVSELIEVNTGFVYNGVYLTQAN